MPYPPRHARRQGQDGFTLIEVMAASVILAVLVLGLGHLWVAVAGEVDQLSLRQKAVFVLNGQMERLAALYLHTDFGEDTAADTTGYGSPSGYPDTRIIYRYVSSYMPGGTADDFTLEGSDFSTDPGQPVFFDNKFFSFLERNYVWIDKDRSLVARLSWVEDNLIINKCDSDGEYRSGQSNPCYCPDWDATGSGQRCREITLFLEYPFRWINGAAEQQVDKLEILSLKTIVGRAL